MTTLQNVTEEKLGPCLIALQAEVAAADVATAMQSAAQRIARQTRIPGFRKGKAPYAVVLRTIGKEALRQEAVEEIADDVLIKLLDERSINAYARPVLEVVSQEPMTLKYTVATRPVIDPGAYRSLRLEPKPAEQIGDTQVDRALAQVQRAHATIATVERAAEIGDIVNMDVKIMSGEAMLIDRKATDVALVEGEEDLTPGFSRAMIGVAKGDSRTINLLVAESDTESGLAGQTLNITAVVHEVKSMTLPALDDELAKTDGRFETLDELRADLKKNLQDNADHVAKETFDDEVLKAAVAGAKVEYPDVMLNEEVNHQIEHFKEDVAQQGFVFDQWLRMNNMSLDTFRSSIRPGSESRLRNTLFLYDIAEREGLKVQADDINVEVESMAARYPEDLRGYVRDAYKDKNSQVALGLTLLQRWTMEKLVAIAKGEVVMLPGDADAARPSDVVVAS
ncbi:MAG: trigger factor [Chloroflexi bacterium]|nr:trigger factor [Chloroflexota bacterium]